MNGPGAGGLGAAADERSAWLLAMPAVFVLIWSTGFIVARYGMPHAPPMGFLAWRYGLSTALFAAWVTLAGAAWPRGRSAWGHLAVCGVLMQAGYLGGVWGAVKLGAGAGIVALVVCLQPVLTALWVSAAGSERRISASRWAGLVLGLLGLLLVVWHKLGVGEVGGASLALAVAALASITAGTLYQKRFVAPCDVRSAGAVQMLAALVVTLPLAMLESESIRWHPEMVGALAWSVGVLTLGGSSLLYLLIQRGAATRVTSLMYLVPPCTALMAAALFGETLGPEVLAGIALTAAGVALAARDPRPLPP